MLLWWASMNAIAFLEMNSLEMLLLSASSGYLPYVNGRMVGVQPKVCENRLELRIKVVLWQPLAGIWTNSRFILMMLKTTMLFEWNFNHWCISCESLRNFTMAMRRSWRIDHVNLTNVSASNFNQMSSPRIKTKWWKWTEYGMAWWRFFCFSFLQTNENCPTPSLNVEVGHNFFETICICLLGLAAAAQSGKYIFLDAPFSPLAHLFWRTDEPYQNTNYFILTNETSVHLALSFQSRALFSVFVTLN